MFVDKAKEEDLLTLKQKIQASVDDSKFAGLGEIGLDGFVPGLNWDKQVRFFHAQLKLARHFDVPVVMHVRKAQDAVLKGLRIYKPRSGIAHAFNGSFQQADHFLNLNMCLGFGGASTLPGHFSCGAWLPSYLSMPWCLKRMDQILRRSGSTNNAIHPNTYRELRKQWLNCAG
jgi:Tat protein secretion system quality control protein TatD with DNase activity